MVESAKDGSMVKLFAGDKEIAPIVIAALVTAGGGIVEGIIKCFSGISTETKRGKIPIGNLRLIIEMLTCCYAIVSHTRSSSHSHPTLCQRSSSHFNLRLGDKVKENR